MIFFSLFTLCILLFTAYFGDQYESRTFMEDYIQYEKYHIEYHSAPRNHRSAPYTPPFGNLLCCLRRN